MRKNSLTASTDTYSTRAAARISGLSIDMVNYLHRHGIVRTTPEDRTGRGVARGYRYADLLLLRLLSRLLDQGISVLRLRKCLVAFQKRGEDLTLLTSKRFVATDGQEVYFGSRDVLEKLGTGQMAFAFVLELGALGSEVRARISIESRAA
ncbi:MerR family transcriptional regulator [Rugamonas sp. FT82W]|uniref:MerR family transcriptional regulator n=1 Tax=Duganella vulcania TaxID=2692166 RepID=A0A845G1H3_9BURK|nr:MerR family transcriptional regulator [Duganella vulcania]MYM87711.1 MerR family transcriptional regulator [Duganella vulcania]